MSRLGALLRREGLRVASGSAAGFLRRLDAVALPPSLTLTVAPLRALLAPAAEQIAVADARLAARIDGDAVMRRLATVPGVGPVTAATFVATLDSAARFAGGTPAVTAPFARHRQLTHSLATLRKEGDESSSG